MVAPSPSDPQAEEVFAAVRVDADGQIDRLRGHRTEADLHPQRVDVDDRPALVEGSVLPGHELVDHGVGGFADQVRADFDPLDLGGVGADVAHTHPAGAQGEWIRTLIPV